MLVTGSLYAGVLDQTEQFIKNHPTRTGVLYDFKTNEAHEYVAATIAEDVSIKNLDISVAWDFDKAIIAQTDYIFKEGTLSPYAGIGIGCDRIESENDLGTVIFESHLGVKF